MSKGKGADFLDEQVTTLPREADAFDLEAASVRDLLSTTPPEREYLVQQLLPVGVVGLLAAAGGTGKSFGILQLAVSLATGAQWLGMPIGQQGPTLIVSAEDDRAEIHRRLLCIVDHYWPLGAGMPERAEALEAVADRVFVVDRVGDDNRLTAQIDRALTRTAMADQIISTARAMENPPVLIVLDPLSRFDGGKPNEADDGTRLIEVAEYIRRETGATVLLPHHVNKASIREASAGQEAIRGSSGLVDGARWAALLATLRRDDAAKFDVKKDEASRFVRFELVKGNYAPPHEGQWLERGRGGVLMPTELAEREQIATEHRQEAVYGQVVEAVARLIRRHGPLSVRHIRDHYAGQGGILKAGDKAVRAALSRAVEEGRFYEVPAPGGRGCRLELPPGDE